MCILDEWREVVEDSGSDATVFPNLKRWTRTADMIRDDLQAARDTWLDDADSEQERADREATHFLRYENEDGQVADFHALRHTFITNLVRNGVQPKVAQELARHSDIKLTMDRYTHVVLQEKADALHALPDLIAEESTADGQPVARTA